MILHPNSSRWQDTRPTTAQFHGECDLCDGRIEPGDPVRRVGHGAVAHQSCYDLDTEWLGNQSEEPDAKPRPQCPNCFEEIPLTGVCGVCDD